MRLGRAVATLVPERAGDAALASLSDRAITSRFHAWLGASGRRYIVSVYALDLLLAHAGIPDFDRFVLIPVARQGLTRRPDDVIAVERESDKGFAVQRALAHGVSEWHVHLLANGRSERATVVADLAARHWRNGLALSA